MPSSLMYTNISEKQESTWIVRLKEFANKPCASFPKSKPCFPHLAYYSVLKMQAANSSKHWCIFTISHGTTSQKAIILICLYAQMHITLLFKFWYHTWSKVKLSLGLITYHMGKWRYSSTHSNLCTIKEVCDQFHAPATSPHRETVPSTIDEEAACTPQPVWTFGGHKNVLSLPVVEIRFLSCSAHSLFSMLTNICMFISDILCYLHMATAAMQDQCFHKISFSLL